MDGDWNSKSPLAKLLASRKFLLMVLDVTLSLLGYFTAKYLAPSALEDVRQLILYLQPVFIVLIGAIAHEDTAELKVEAQRLELRKAQMDLEAAQLAAITMSRAVEK